MKNNNIIIYRTDMTMDELQCMLHEDYLHMVDELDMPLWYYQQYEESMYLLHDMYKQEKEVDNRILLLNDLSDEDLMKLYCQQEEDIDYLCLLNGYED